MNKGIIKKILFLISLLVSLSISAQDIEKLKANAVKGDNKAKIQLSVYFLHNGTDEEKRQVYSLVKSVHKGGELTLVRDYCLGICYYHGWGVEQNYDKAYRIFEELSMLGVDNTLPDVGWYLGECYYYGHGTKINEKEAKSAYYHSAMFGSLSSRITLGRFVLEDFYSFEKKDHKRIFDWLKEIVERPNSDSYAQYILGCMYQYGRGTEANKQEAIKWYKKSNEPEAKKQLAMLERKEKNQEPIKKEEPILLADTKTQNNKGETITQLTPVESKTVVAETSQSKIVAQNTSQVQEQSKQSTAVEKKKERGIALIIGNAAYNYTKHLNSPIKDAEDIGLSLKKLGFEVMVERNLNSGQQKEVIDRFTSVAKQYDVAIFYYSGHGIQRYNENYLLPTDFKGEKDSELYYCARPRGVIEDLDQAGCNLKIIIIDACRDNPFSMSKGGSSGLAPMEGTAGTYIVYATAENKTAIDGKVGENSRFTKALLHALNKPGLNLHEVFDVVGEEVSKESNGTQLPKVNHQPPIGKFIFNNR